VYIRRVTPAPESLPPRPSARVFVAIGLAAASCAASWLATRVRGFGHQDFESWWLAARALLHGQNPYVVVRSLFAFGFVYPLPTAIATIPFALLPPTVAGPLFVGVSCGLLAFVITRDAWWPLLLFLSGSMAECIAMGHWSALLTVALLTPSLTWLGVFKPNIGLAILAYRPSIKAALVMLLIGLASLVVMPTWPQEWISAASKSPGHFAPWRVSGGILLLSALARWRRPEARFLAALALIPSSPIAYEALPLFVIPTRRIQSIVLVLLSDALLVYIDARADTRNVVQYFRVAGPAMVCFMYLPALIMVLARPNTGALPEWVERQTRLLPACLRGSSGSST
jgi:hypothetical protein